MNSHKSTLDRIAVSLGATIREAESHNLPMNEEPLTEFLLLKIKQSFRKDIQVRAFTKAEESINGADWEVLFQGRSGGVQAFRCQAKRERSMRFDLAYRKGSPWRERQVVKFLHQAAIDQRAPIYILYSDRTREPTRKCRCSTNRNSPPFSIAALNGGTALLLAASGLTAQVEVLTHACAWSCLLGCDMDGTEGEDQYRRQIDTTISSLNQLSGLEHPNTSEIATDLLRQFSLVTQGQTYARGSFTGMSAALNDYDLTPFLENNAAGVEEYLDEHLLTGIAIASFGSIRWFE